MPANLEDILSSVEYRKKLRSAHKIGIDLATSEGLQKFAAEYNNLKVLAAEKTSTPAKPPRRKNTDKLKTETSPVSRNFDNPELDPIVSPSSPLGPTIDTPIPLVNLEESRDENSIYYRAAVAVADFINSKDKKEKSGSTKMAMADDVQAQLQRLQAELNQEKHRSAGLERELREQLSTSGRPNDTMIEFCKEMKDISLNSTRILDRLSEKENSNKNHCSYCEKY